MAHYENLPIYKRTVELTVYIEQVVRGFSKYHKYTIGSDLRNLSRSLAVMVIKANSMRDKIPILTELRDKSEEMKLMIMIGKEVKAFNSFKQFQHAAGLTVEISKQSEGWLKSQREKGTESPKAQALASEPKITVRPSRP
ncbi:MAG: four helix bundle protein [Nitrospinae bacterium]|nr:four helix bundle protein [Nitrospinota bacterium]